MNVEHAGQIIADLYRLEEQLGRGAMGRIWRAEHLRLKAKVAIKFLDPSVSDDPDAFNRFLREAQSAAAVRSAHVVQVFDCGIDAGIPYISMELLEGESLDKRLSARKALAAFELNETFSGVAQAVDTAHELGVIHRDLKPGNIFIARERDVEIAKVLDFGIAKLRNRAADLDSAAGTRTGIMLGTPYYMSPEQVRGSRDLDHRTDLWSLAVIAFECLTGELPFRGESVGDIIVQICTSTPTLPSELAAVPPGFDDWFLKGTSKDPGGRFTTARQMSESLSEILARAPASAAPARSARADSSRAPATLPSVPAPLGVDRAAPASAASSSPALSPATRSSAGFPSAASSSPRSDAGDWAPSERSGTSRSLPASGRVPPSQSTQPTTAPIPPASARTVVEGPHRARGRWAGAAAVAALSCGVSAAVLWAFPPRQASSVLQEAALAPASSSQAPPVAVRAPAARDNPNGSVDTDDVAPDQAVTGHAVTGHAGGIEAAGAARDEPAPEPSAGIPSPHEPPLDAIYLDADALGPAEPSPSASAARDPSTPRAATRTVRRARKNTARRAPEVGRSPSPDAPASVPRSPEVPSASPPREPLETDLFSERR